MRSALLVLISVLVAVAAAEGALRALGFGRDFLGFAVAADPRYGHRIAAPGLTDDWGFRNPRVPGRVDLVAIGDSQTYGVCADAEGAWPPQLGALLHRTSYNLGLGGYGPVQYDLLWNDYVPRLDPAVVVVGLYLGNDIQDAFASSSLLAPSDPLRPPHPPPVQTVFEEPRDRLFDGTRRFLYRHSVLYNMAKIVFPQLTDVFARSLRPSSGSGAATSGPVIWSRAEAAMRLGALRRDRPENIEGLRITLGYLERLAGKCRSASRRCVVAIIPTKESVLQDHIRAVGAADSDLEALWTAEDEVRSMVLEATGRHGLQTVDTLPALRAAAASTQVYPALDDHPNRDGYGVIAAAIAQAVASDLPPIRER